MTTADLAKVICCEGAACLRPDACDAGREYRVPVSPRRAAEAVHARLCEAWKQYRGVGPMTVVREPASVGNNGE